MICCNKNRQLYELHNPNLKPNELKINKSVLEYMAYIEVDELN